MKNLKELLKQETISNFDLNNSGIDLNSLDEKTVELILSKLESDPIKKSQKKETKFRYIKSVDLLKEFNGDEKNPEFKKKNKRLRTKLRKETEQILLSVEAKNKKSIDNFISFYKDNFCLNDFSLESICANNTDISKKLFVKSKLTIITKHISKKK